jgi:hypothetical protein
MMILQNCINEDLTIPRCSSIGYIENVKHPHFDQIPEIKSNEWEIKVSQNPQLPEPEPPVSGGKLEICCSSQNECPY